MEYRNTIKTKSETRKNASAAVDFWIVLNMFTIPKAMFLKIHKIFFEKSYDFNREIYWTVNFLE